MQNLDVPKIIEAAATSNLGVLSLLVLVLAFLAWRFFQTSGDKVKLAAFGMMFVGALGFGGSVMMAGDPSPASAGPTAKPSATSLPAPATPQSDPDRPIATTPANAEGVRDISGEWHDSEGYRYVVRQSGAAFSYVSTLDGERASSGEGTIRADRLEYRYRNEATVDSGTCQGRLAADARAIDGKCGNGTDQWGFRIER